MDDSTQQLFSRQLASWAEAAIEHGRFPFRKVEISPVLSTELGELQPPLLFWINRDSCMAGGVIVFPGERSDDELEKGSACARALGLNHLVGWAPREIVFWQIRGESLSRHKTIDLSEARDPSRFRDALVAVMEELKVLAVLGAVPPDQLSAHYLANLCLGTRHAALTSLAEAFRLARGDNLLAPDAPTGDCAEQKAAMTLLRLLGLVLHDLLPTGVQPEGLERAMTFALEALPDHCRSVLRIAEEELPLPDESAVVFHHLFRRLTQLRLQKDRRRSARLFEILFERDCRIFGGYPLPAGKAGAPPRELLLHPDRFPRQEGLMVVATPPLLACIVLGRHLSNLPPLIVQTPDLFTLLPGTAPQEVRGTLVEQTVPQGSRRRNLAARLRLSWPARRFPLPPRTPAWLWELLHLIGIAAPGARLDIVVPASCLNADYVRPLLEILAEQFTLERLALADELLRMHFVKTPPREGTTLLEGPGGLRQLALEPGTPVHPARLSLMLQLPDDLFELLERGTLLSPDESTSLDSRGLHLFCRSSLGRLLWDLVSGKRSLPTEAKLPAEIRRRGMPLPDAGVLTSLRQLWPSGRSGPPSAARIDRELALWLGDRIPASRPPAPPARSRSARPSQRIQQETGVSAEAIAETVFSDGLPRFPGQYLYDYYRPPLEEYRFEGPLSMDDDFFGSYRLRDQQGTSLVVEGEETARALQMASFNGRQPVALPVDRQLTATILERYLEDLRRLRRKLLRETHLHAAGGRAAERMAKKIWRSRNLPPWELIETDV